MFRDSGIPYNFFFFVTGCLLHLVCYESVEPSIVFLVFLFFGLLPLYPFNTPGGVEKKIYFRLFSIYWMMAGVSAYYAVFLHDYVQTVSDAAGFYELASGNAVGLSLEDLKVITEGSGAVMIWRGMYDFFEWFGFSKGMYIGILLNIVAVSLSGVWANKILNMLYGDDSFRANILLKMFSFCGIFWLYGGIHMRDGVVFAGVTLLLYFWCRYIYDLSTRSLFYLVVATIAAMFFFVFLRGGFAFVPIAMGVAGVVSILLYKKGSYSQKFKIYLMSVLGILVFGLLVVLNLEMFTSKIARGYESYAGYASDSAASGSLGMSMIVNRALPVRLLLGSVYVYVFPIPFWSGFFEDSAYQLFKSLNAVFIYFLIPLFVLSLLRVFRYKQLRTPLVMFNLLLVIGFTLAIAGTSLETRHMGSFFVPMFIFSLLPDLKIRQNLIDYKILLGFFMLGVVAIHSAWIVIKGI
jgi:hypothetical protein